MASTRNVPLAVYVEAVEGVDFGQPLQEAWKRLDHTMIFESGFGGDNPVCAIHDGDLHVTGDFQAPAYHLLIRGNLVVDGMLDINFADADEEGSFIVTGDVKCRVFLNHYGKVAVVGGDLTATEALCNAFQDSMLYVGGSIMMQCFLGYDMCAKFGGTAEMEYGIGYCLPFKYTDAAAAAVRPRFDKDATLDRMAIPNVRDLWSQPIIDYVRSGKPLFR